jgi:7-cyano-7-deazaguanine synthase
MEENRKCHKVVVSLSGGIDSSTVLALTLKGFHPKEILAVSFFYGSKHNQFENEAAKKIAEYYKVEWKLIFINNIFSFVKSHLMIDGGDVPEGHYTNKSMKQTVVPGRNLIFISILAAIASSYNANLIKLGVHAGDHAIYPDCRPEFIEAIQSVLSTGFDEKIEIKTPFLHNNKSQIIATGKELGVPYELTRTCYKNQETACGKCGSCVERLEAFAKNNIIDPIKYEE